MNDFIHQLEIEFQNYANPIIAAGQKAYMKNHFDFYGIKAPDRRKIQKPFLINKYLPPHTELSNIVQYLWNKPQREYQYFGQELVEKYRQQFTPDIITLIEFMITNKSWWDTVDFIATKLVGTYFKTHPQLVDRYVEKWLDSQNIWLQRTTLLFQLHYKETLNTDLLTSIINRLTGSREFFINKAIGWILRQYSKTNPQWVINFVAETPLDKLSYKEATRLL